MKSRAVAGVGAVFAMEATLTVFASATFSAESEPLAAGDSELVAVGETRILTGGSSVYYQQEIDAVPVAGER